MSDNIVKFTKPAPRITNERRPIDMSIVDDMTLLIMFVDVINEMKERSHRVKDMHVSDASGRTWSMPAIMRRMQQQINYIIIACGRGM